jgi:hypothetical protein
MLAPGPSASWGEPQAMGLLGEPQLSGVDTLPGAAPSNSDRRLRRENSISHASGLRKVRLWLFPASCFSPARASLSPPL